MRICKIKVAQNEGQENAPGSSSQHSEQSHLVGDDFWSWLEKGKIPADYNVDPNVKDALLFLKHNENETNVNRLKAQALGGELLPYISDMAEIDDNWDEYGILQDLRPILDICQGNIKDADGNQLTTGSPDDVYDSVEALGKAYWASKNTTTRGLNKVPRPVQVWEQRVSMVNHLRKQFSADLSQAAQNAGMHELSQALAGGKLILNPDAIGEYVGEFQYTPAVKDTANSYIKEIWDNYDARMWDYNYWYLRNALYSDFHSGPDINQLKKQIGRADVLNEMGQENHDPKKIMQENNVEDEQLLNTLLINLVSIILFVMVQRLLKEREKISKYRSR